MKFIKSLSILIFVGVLGTISSLVFANQFKKMNALNNGIYGPTPKVAALSYSFEGIQKPFNSTLDLKRSKEFSRKEFEILILDSLNPKSRKKFKKYLPHTLKMAEDYQVDPFWIISVMMVESDFDINALSHKGAQGLMQVKPDTAQYLRRLMGKSSDENINLEVVEHPHDNIETGTFYLKKLLQNFGMDYQFATMAYNLGPNSLKKTIKNNKFGFLNLSYFLKVQENYQGLTENFSNELKRNPSF